METSYFAGTPHVLYIRRDSTSLQILEAFRSVFSWKMPEDYLTRAWQRQDLSASQLDFKSNVPPANLPRQLQFHIGVHVPDPSWLVVVPNTKKNEKVKV